MSFNKDFDCGQSMSSVDEQLTIHCIEKEVMSIADVDMPLMSMDSNSPVDQTGGLQTSGMQQQQQKHQSQLRQIKPNANIHAGNQMLDSMCLMNIRNQYAAQGQLSRSPRSSGYISPVSPAQSFLTQGPNQRLPRPTGKF